MALVSRKEFAAIVGTTVNIVNVNVGRKKIIVRPDKKIDSDNIINRHFIKLQKQVKKKKIQNKKPLDVIIKEAEYDDVPERKLTASEKRRIKKQETESEEIMKWAVRKERANAVRAETDSELKKLQLEKMMGQLIPVELMGRIFKLNIQNVFMSFENELVNLASIYCDILAGGDRSKLSEIVDLMRQNLFKIIKETKNNAAKEIEGAIDEYSETRSRGERK